MRLAITVALLALVVSCDPHTSDAAEEGASRPADSARVMPWDDAAVFARLKRRLPVVRLPYRITAWGADPAYIELNEGEQQLLRGVGNGVAIGLLPDTLKVFHVLWLGGGADWWLTTLSTFDREGVFIHSEELFIGQCGGPAPCYTCSETISIGADLSVLTTDTVRECQCDTNEVEIPGSCSRYVTKRTGKIGPTGVRMSEMRREPLPLEETRPALEP